MQYYLNIQNFRKVNSHSTIVLCPNKHGQASQNCLHRLNVIPIPFKQCTHANIMHITPEQKGFCGTTTTIPTCTYFCTNIYLICVDNIFRGHTHSSNVTYIDCASIHPFIEHMHIYTTFRALCKYFHCISFGEQLLGKICMFGASPTCTHTHTRPAFSAGHVCVIVQNFCSITGEHARTWTYASLVICRSVQLGI